MQCVTYAYIYTCHILTTDPHISSAIYSLVPFTLKSHLEFKNRNTLPGWNVCWDLNE